MTNIFWEKRCTYSNCSRKDCDKMCKICKFYYCSKKHQTLDWVNHKITCAPRKCDRLRKHVEFYINDKSNINYDLYLSSRILHFVNKVFVGHVKSLKYSDITHACVICDTPITYKGPLNNVSFTLREPKSNFKITCYRCNYCNDKDLKLCPINYMTLYELKLYLLMCIKQFKLCRDLKQYICSFIVYDSNIISFDNERDLIEYFANNSRNDH